MGCVYKITNTINHKLYIGITTQDIGTRWRKHKTASKHVDTYLYRAMRKYGLKNFNISAIEYVNNDALSERERYWIQELNTMKPNGYNLTIGGEKLYGENNPFYKKKHSDKTKEIMRKKRLGRFTGKDNPFYGKSHTDDTKKLLSLANSGYKHTEEYKQYMREINLNENNPFYGKSHTDDTKKLIGFKNSTKNIVLLDLNRDYIVTFETMREAYEFVKSNGLCGKNTKYESVAKSVRESMKNNVVRYKHYWTIQNEGVTTIETTAMQEGSKVE